MKTAIKDLNSLQRKENILKTAGIKNHSIVYREVKPGQYQVYAIDFLGESKGFIKEKSSLERFNKAANQKQISISTKDAFPEGNFEERMEEFKDKYLWDSSDTQALAGYLLESMPEKVREAGLDKIIKKLHKRLAEDNEEMVDEETFLKNIEEAIPPHIAPKMIVHIKKQINEFKGEEIYEIPKTSSGELKQDSF